MANTKACKFDVREQIMDNLRFLYPECAEPTISVATHDNLWWVIISTDGSDNDRLRSGQGFESVDAALENMLVLLGVEVWEQAKEMGIKLSK